VRSALISFRLDLDAAEALAAHQARYGLASPSLAAQHALTAALAAECPDYAQRLLARGRAEVVAEVVRVVGRYA